MIDWTRPKGHICGDSPVPGARYEQDGKFFRLDGTEAGGENKKSAPIKTKAVEPSMALKSPESEFKYQPPKEPVKETPASDAAIKKEMQTMVDKGYTHTEIGKQFNVSRQKVTRILCK